MVLVWTHTQQVPLSCKSRLSFNKVRISKIIHDFQLTLLKSIMQAGTDTDCHKKEQKVVVACMEVILRFFQAPKTICNRLIRALQTWANQKESWCRYRIRMACRGRFRFRLLSHRRPKTVRRADFLRPNLTAKATLLGAYKRPQNSN